VLEWTNTGATNSHSSAVHRSTARALVLVRPWFNRPAVGRRSNKRRLAAGRLERGWSPVKQAGGRPAVKRDV
jgi:hypothetical protein